MDLDLSYNLLTGGISSSICNASSLQNLELSNNKLTGTIPQCLVNSSFLCFLNLGMNRFDGTLPNTSSMNSLVSLNLNDNRLEGPLPESLSNCMYLQVLNLGNNQIEDTFPHWLPTLPYLKVLVLRANKLHGPISIFKTKHGFPSLNIFDISSNNFSGQIPEDYIQRFESMLGQDEVVGNSQQYMQWEFTITIYYYSPTTLTTKGTSVLFKRIPTNFVSIDLSGNNFEGKIPNAIGELQALIGLNLSHNRLSGPIPQSMGNLINLESLDLSSNMLTGKIPTELMNMKFLEVLNLSYNNLVGEIPQGKQFGTFMNDSYEGNLDLCGVPLSVKCGEEHDQHFLWREEKFGFGWEAVAIGYGCGMVFGVVMGSFVFLMGKPEFLVKMFGG